LPIANGIIGAGGDIAWPVPLRADDAIHVENEIVAVTPSRSRPDRGIVTVVSRTLNQDGTVVQVATMKLLVYRRGNSA
jgi:acyl dehydratase